MNLSAELKAAIVKKEPLPAAIGVTSAVALTAQSIGLENLKTVLSAFYALHQKDAAKVAVFRNAVEVSKSVLEIEGLVVANGYAHLLKPLHQVPKDKIQRADKIEFQEMSVAWMPLKEQPKSKRVSQLMEVC